MSICVGNGSSGPDPIRTRLVDLLSVGIEAVEPFALVADNVDVQGGGVSIAGSRLDLDSVGRLVVVAVGKAAEPMARAVRFRLGPTIDTGVVIGPEAVEVPDGWTSFTGGHPVPTDGSEEGGTAALDLARSLKHDDVLLVLLSGGASALMEVPIDGVSLEDIAGITEQLLVSGAPIDQINTVRRRLSLVKGGGLADAARPARVFTLVLSDVVGSPVHAIGSGPTVADPTTAGDARGVLEQYGIESVLRLRTGDSLVSRSELSVIGDGATVAYAIRNEALGLGMPAHVASVVMEGEASDVAVECLELATDGLTIFAGETTVTVTGTGRGGRNQEGALSAAISIAGQPGVVFAALGTDGVDGPTDAAGAIVDGQTTRLGEQLGLEATEYLNRNDAYTYLDAVGCLLRCGPTGTNVGDIWLVWRDAG
ncbi:MAG: DUF4147 domain-containing protein [Acidimicrobiia bacterium]|nr:DUF4147 domain-containing protein [Acidimicrobiia bacterium]